MSWCYPSRVATRPLPGSMFTRWFPTALAAGPLVAEWRRQYQWPLGITLAYGAALLAADWWHPGAWRPLFRRPTESMQLLGDLSQWVAVAVIGIALVHVVAA